LRRYSVATDAGDKPLTPITITGATVFTNPYKEMAEEEDRLAAEAVEAEAKEARQRTEAMNPGRWFSDPAGEAQREDEKNGVVGASGFVGAGGGGVGKYMTAAVGPGRCWGPASSSPRM